MPFGYSWGELGNAGLAGLDAPRQAIWNLGPALVGRSGQGPKDGRELLGAIGMNPDSPAAHGLGKGLDLVANPMNLAGMGMFGRAAAGTGAARTAAPEAAVTLAGRLEQMAGSGLQGQLAARPASGAVGGISEVAAGSAARAAPATSEIAAQMAARGPASGPSPASWATTRPPPASTTPLPRGRSVPISTIAESPGSPSWLQQSATEFPNGYPNFPTPLVTQSLGAPAANAAAETGGGILGRLQRMAPQRQVPAMDY